MADGEVNGTINVEVIYREAGGGGGFKASDITGGSGASGSAAASAAKKGARESTDSVKFLKAISGTLTVGAMIKQSKIMSSALGTLLQLFGALIDVFLMPFIPLLIPLLKGFAAIVKWFARFMKDPTTALKEAWNAFIELLKDSISGLWDFLEDPDWGAIITSPNWETLLKMGVGGVGLLALIAALSGGVSLALAAPGFLAGLLGIGGGAAAGGTAAAVGGGLTAAAVAAVVLPTIAIVGTGVLSWMATTNALKRWAPDWYKTLAGWDTKEDVQREEDLKQYGHLSEMFYERLATFSTEMQKAILNQMPTGDLSARVEFMRASMNAPQSPAEQAARFAGPKKGPSDLALAAIDALSTFSSPNITITVNNTSAVWMSEENFDIQLQQQKALEDYRESVRYWDEG